MKNKNKILVLMLSLVLVFSSCVKNASGVTKVGEEVANNKLKIVATTFPQYDWVREILGDKVKDVELTLLLDNGVDLHSYKPTADDIIKIKNADLFIHVGGISDKWVQDVMKEADKSVEVIDLLQSLGDKVKMAEHVEGMEKHDHDHEHGEHKDGEHEHEKHKDGEHEHEEHKDGEHEHEEHKDGEHEHEEHKDGEHEHEEHKDGEHEHEEHKDGEHEHEEHKDGEHEHEEHKDGEHEHEEHKDGDHEHGEHKDGEHEHEEHKDGEHHHEHEDEHVWLSVKNARILVDVIADKLEKIDTKNAKVYAENAKKYNEKLDELDKEYEKIVSGAKNKTLLFGDRFPFRYLVDDYSLEYFAAFSGCSAESEASFETIAFLSDKVKELNLSTVMTIEGDNKKIAETIVKTSGKECDIVSMDSMQSITMAKVKEGAKYLHIMKQNAKALEKALK